MDELDLLKQHWNNEGNFPKVDKEQIRQMLHRSSSSIIKWIFLISVIELLLGLALFFVVGPEETEHSVVYTVGYVVYDIIFYAVILYFIYQFFSSYRRIKNTTSTKVLLNAILKTRRHVDHYIRFNIYCIICSCVFVSVEKLFQRYQTTSTGHFIFTAVLVAVLVSLFCWLFLFVVKLYYKLLYQRLVKKLNRNYDELTSMEQEEPA